MRSLWIFIKNLIGLVTRIFRGTKLIYHVDWHTNNTSLLAVDEDNWQAPHDAYSDHLNVSDAQLFMIVNTFNGMDMMITRPAGATEKYSVGQFADASFTANADYRLEGTFRYPQFAEEEGTICGATVQIKTGGPSFLANSDVQMGATLQFKTVSGVSTISLELINLSDVSPVSASLSNAEYLKLLGSSDFTLKLYFNRSAGTAKGELYVDDTLKLTKTATIKDKGTLGDPLDPYIPVKNSIYTCAGVSFDLAQSTQLKPTTLAGVQCRDFMVYKKY